MMQLTNYYTMTLCTPARASIMTGRYPVRYGMQYAVIMPGSPWGLPLDEKVGRRRLVLSFQSDRNIVVQ